MLFQNKLDASNNELRSLPENFCKSFQRSLQYLYLNSNKFKVIGPEIYCLNRLVELNLSANQIESIDSPERWQCKRLKSLNLADNSLGGQSVKTT